LPARFARTRRFVESLPAVIGTRSFARKHHVIKKHSEKNKFTRHDEKKDHVKYLVTHLYQSQNPSAIPPSLLLHEK
jgi:hypothetical protein